MDPGGPRGGPTVVRILRLAAGGDGVAKLEDGRIVFVPRTVPGDLAELTSVRTYARLARARLGRLLESGPGRIEPRCPHFVGERCGGCQLQQLSVPAQREAKRQVVADALGRIGGLNPAVPPLQEAREAWGYRTRITLALGPGRRLAGFHPVGEAGRVFSLESCAIARPELNRLWAALRPRLHLLPVNATTVTLRLDRAGGLHLLVRVTGQRVWSRPAALGQALIGADVGTTLWWQPEGGAPRVVHGGGATAFPATVFEQVHPELGDRIRHWAVEALGLRSGTRAWDLYAGIGETTRLMADRGAEVFSVELDPRAVEWASRQPGSGKIVREVGRVEDWVDRLPTPHVVIANPPRAGLDARVIAALLRPGAERLVYVSCDPATLARDLAGLCRTSSTTEESLSYRLTGVQPFDLFPQTAHVETVAVLER